MANFTVTTFDDVVDANDGVLSLREAIQAANALAGPDSIDFAQAGGVITLDGGTLLVEGEFAINGRGVTIRGADGAVFDEHGFAGEGVSMTISNVTIENMGGDGINLDDGSELSVRSSTIRGNYAGGVNAGFVTVIGSEISDNDGGIYSTDKGVIGNQVTISGSTISENFAGGVLAFDGLTIENSTISGNSGGVAYYSDGQGAGVVASGDVTISGSVFEGNSAFAMGAAIHLSGAGSTQITDTDFIDNRVTSRDGTYMGRPTGGGAISNNYRGRTIDIDDSTFTGNTTAGGQGGAILRLYGAGISIDGSTFIQNQAVTGGAVVLDGGGLSRIGDETYFQQNSASEDGGAVAALGDGVVTIENSDFTANTAGSDGGAVVTQGGVGVNVIDTSFDANRALGEASDGSTGRGGVLAILGGGSLNVTESNLAQNDATVAGGAIAVVGASEQFPTRVDISQTDIFQNETGFVRDDGFGIAGNGGGIYLVNAELTLEQSSVSGNIGKNRGGGIHATGSGVSIADSTLANNMTGEVGGAVFFDPGSNDTLGIRHATITGNEAGFSGGGVYAGGEVALLNSIIALNEADLPEFRDAEFFGSVGSNGANIFSSDVNGAVAGDVTDATAGDLVLGRLGDNGGPTSTVALGPGSIAINTGDPGAARSTDQRGLPRNGAPDIGALENQDGIDVSQDPLAALPELTNSVRVDPALINGVNPELLRGEGEITVEVVAQGGQFNNSIGFYTYGPEGVVDEVGMLFEGENMASGEASLPGLGPLQQFGIFLVQDGFNQNSFFRSTVYERGEFELRGFNGRTPLDVDIDNVPSLFFVIDDGREIEVDGALLFAASSAPGEQHLNPRDGLSTISAISEDGDLVIAFEDKKPGEGSNDSDFEDVILVVRGLDLDDVVVTGDVV